MEQTGTKVCSFLLGPVCWSRGCCYSCPASLTLLVVGHWGGHSLGSTVRPLSSAAPGQRVPALRSAGSGTRRQKGRCGVGTERACNHSPAQHSILLSWCWQGSALPLRLLP